MAQRNIAPSSQKQCPTSGLPHFRLKRTFLLPRLASRSNSINPFAAIELILRSGVA